MNEKTKRFRKQKTSLQKIRGFPISGLLIAMNLHVRSEQEIVKEIAKLGQLSQILQKVNNEILI